MPAGNVTLLKLIEYKSYLYPSKIDLPQFLNYMKSISDLRQLNYVFNSAKVSLEQAKSGVRAFFLKSGNAEAIWGANESMFLGMNLILSNGTPVIEKDIFRTYITENSYSIKLFDFVLTSPN